MLALALFCWPAAADMVPLCVLCRASGGVCLLADGWIERDRQEEEAVDRGPRARLLLLFFLCCFLTDERRGDEDPVDSAV